MDLSTVGHINAAKNILRVGQIDSHGDVIKSQAIGDLEEIPLALQKVTRKIERYGKQLTSWSWEWVSYTIFSRVVIDIKKEIITWSEII